MDTTSNQMFEEFNSEIYNDAMDTSQQEVGISEESSIEQSNILYGTNINTEEYRLVFPYCGDDGNGIIINCDQQFQEFNPGLYAINLANTNPKIAETGLIFIQEQTNTSEPSNIEDVGTKTHDILSTGNSDSQGNTEENEESSQESHFQFSCTKKDDAANETVAVSEETVTKEGTTVNDYIDDPDDPDIIDICTENGNDSNNDSVTKMSIENRSLTSVPRSTNMYIAVTEKNIFTIHGIDVSLPISCDICEEDFNDMALFDDHMSMHVEHRHFMCQLCPKTYASWENLVAHRKVSHQGQVISCEQCSCSKHHHKLGPLKFPVGKFPSGCEECNKGFSTSSQLNKHYRIHATDGYNKEKLEPSKKIKNSSRVTENDVNSIEKDEVELNPPLSSEVTCSTAKVSESNFMEAVPSTSGIQNTRKVSVYKCNKCQKELLSIQALKLHTKSQCCATGIQYKCPYCCSVFDDMMSYKNHKSTHQEMACDSQKGVKKMTNMVANVANASSHQSVEVYRCFNCQMSFSTPRDMQQHIERVHYQRPNVKLTCDICSSNQPVNHFMKHYLLCMRSKQARNILNEKSKFVCFECDNVYNEAKALLEHKKTHFSADKTYICEICGIMMHQLSAFNKHLVTHSPYRMNLPEVVHNEDTSKNKLTRRNPISIYMCEYCGREFKTKTSLQLHIRRHTGEKPYQCTYCSKAFYTGQQLSVHVRQHTGERPYHCPVCKKSFSSATVLYTHKKVHTTTTQHACPVCGKKFFWRSAYHNHMRIHSGNRPFKCEICSKTFLFKNRLTAHIKRHEEGKISNFIYDLNQTQEVQLHYQCSDCGQSFSTPQELENHHEEKCYLTMITFLPPDSDTNKDNSLVYLDSTNDPNTFCEEQQVAF